jgi:hypothetical protein
MYDHYKKVIDAEFDLLIYYIEQSLNDRANNAKHRIFELLDEITGTKTTQKPAKVAVSAPEPKLTHPARPKAAYEALPTHTPEQSYNSEIEEKTTEEDLPVVVNEYQEEEEEPVYAPKPLAAPERKPLIVMPSLVPPEEPPYIPSVPTVISDKGLAPKGKPKQMPFPTVKLNLSSTDEDPPPADDRYLTKRQTKRAMKTGLLDAVPDNAISIKKVVKVKPQRLDKNGNPITRPVGRPRKVQVEAFEAQQEKPKVQRKSKTQRKDKKERISPTMNRGKVKIIQNLVFDAVMTNGGSVELNEIQNLLKKNNIEFTAKNERQTLKRWIQGDDRLQNDDAYVILKKKDF